MVVIIRDLMLLIILDQVVVELELLVHVHQILMQVVMVVLE